MWETPSLYTPADGKVYTAMGMGGSYLSPLDGRQLPLLLLRVDISTDDEPKDVKERHPSLLWQELLRNDERNWGCHPRDLHHWKEALLDIMLDLMERPCAIDICQTGQHDDVLERRNEQVGDEDLEDFGLGGGVVGEDALEEGDQNVAERGGDEGTVGGHFGDTGGEVGSMLWAVFGDYGSEKLLESHEGTGGKHFGAEWVVLEGFEVDLNWVS